MFVSHYYTESGDETSNLTSLKNKTLHEESIIPLVGDNRKAGFISDGGTEPALFTEKMIAGNGAPLAPFLLFLYSSNLFSIILSLCVPLSDQNDCYSLHCAVSARCVLEAGNPLCLCQEGFTGDGQTCLGKVSLYAEITILNRNLTKLAVIYAFTFDLPRVVPARPETV